MLLCIKIFVLLPKKEHIFCHIWIKKNDIHKATKLRPKRKMIAGIFRDGEMEANEVIISLVPWQQSNLE